MATTQEIQNWLAANPGASDATIAAAMSQYGVTPAQMAAATGLDPASVQARYTAATAPTTTSAYAPSDYHLANVLESNEPQAFKDLYSALQSGQARVGAIQNDTSYYDFAPSSETTYTVFDASGKPIPGVSVDPSSGRITLPSAGGFLYLNTPIGQGGTLAPITDYQSQVGYQGGSNSFTDFVREIAPFALTAATAGGGGAWLGNLLAPGAAAATQAALGGAAFGGGISALTGQNVLKGALLGGLGGYASSTLGQALNAGVTDVNALQAAADADMAAGMLPEFGTNAAYDSAMANLMAGSPGAVSQLQNIVNSQVGGLYGPDNIDVGGGWNPAGYSGADMSALPQADYSNEGRNYPTPESTQGPGGSPINASMAAAGLPAGLGTAAKLAAAALGAKGVQTLLTPQGTGGGGGGGDGFNPLGGYTFNPGAFQASIPDPAMFRPREGVVTVSDAIRQAAARQGAAQPAQQAPQPMAEGGPTKPKYTGKAALSAMSPWERAAAQLNNAAYFARMPVGITAPQNAIGQLGQFAAGGGISDLGSYSDGGRMLKGAGDGMSDSIPATISGKRPARLADGEFVVPADVVSGLGNGSTDAGAKQLYQMMDRVRQARTGTKKQGKEINALKHLPA